MNDFSESPSAWKGPFQRANVGRSSSTRQTDLLLPDTPPPVELEIPISQLPLAGPLFGNEDVALVQNGITKRATASQIGATGQGPVFINKAVSLIYLASIGQMVFSLSSPDYYGRTFILTDDNALQVTLGGIRLTQDDGSGTFGQYSVNLSANTVTLTVPFSTDPVAIVGAGDMIVFDVFNLNNQTFTVNVNDSQIHTQSLTVTALNTFASLDLTPNGAMTILYVNGRAFSDDSAPPSFAVTGPNITWLDTLFSVSPTDSVVATFTYGSGGGGSGGGGITPVVQQKTLALYYAAVAGQTTFSLFTPDLFGASYVLSSSSELTVTRNGLRLTPNDGSDVGAYAVDRGGNSVILLWPAGAGETVTIDLFGVGSGGGGGGGGGGGPASVFVSAAPPSSPIIGSLWFDSIGLSLYIWFNDGTSQWWVPTSPVVSAPPASWAASLPTTLPPTAGVVWNNGGVISVS